MSENIRDRVSKLEFHNHEKCGNDVIIILNHYHITILNVIISLFNYN